MLETLATVAIVSLAIPRLREWLLCVPQPSGGPDRACRRRSGRPPLLPTSSPTVQTPPMFQAQIATPFEGDAALSSSDCCGGAQEQIIARVPTGDEPADDLISTNCSWLEEGSNWTLALSDSFSASSWCTSYGAGHASSCLKTGDEEEGTRAITEARIVGRSGQFYVIHAAAGNATLAWTVLRKYRDFKILDAQVRANHADLPRLPQRSIFFRRHFKPGFTHKFEEGLEAYIEALVSNSSTAAEPAVHHFLGFVGHVENDL